MRSKLLRTRPAVTVSTWMSSRLAIRRFSGRVTPCIAPMIAVVLGAAQHVAQRQAAGHRVGIGIVVQQDQHAVGVGEVALVLLDARAGQRAAELGRERAAEQLREVEIRDFRETARSSSWRSWRSARADVRARRSGVPPASRIAVEDLLAGSRRPLSSTMTQVFGREVGLEVGSRCAAGRRRSTGSPSSWRRRASGRLSTRNSTSKTRQQDVVEESG